jgi:hypothetical protein
MKLADLPPLFIDGDYPKFSESLHALLAGEQAWDPEIAPVFHLSYYDGPLSAVCTCRGIYFYGHAAYDSWRTYWAFWTLTNEELEIFLENHALFEKHVGSHTTYVADENGGFKRKGVCDKPMTEWAAYYDAKDMKRVNTRAITERDIFGIARNPFL